MSCQGGETLSVRVRPVGLRRLKVSEIRENATVLESS